MSTTATPSLSSRAAAGVAPKRRRRRRRRAGTLGRDVLAGTSVAFVLIPQALA